MDDQGEFPFTGLALATRTAAEPLVLIGVQDEPVAWLLLADSGHHGLLFVT
jgi:hypothetical protein